MKTVRNLSRCQQGYVLPCGWEFPAPEVKPLRLHNDDIMGNGKTMRVKSWLWRVSTSPSGKEMVTITYFSADNLAERCSTSLSGGYAQDKAQRLLSGIAKRSLITHTTLKDSHDAFPAKRVQGQRVQGNKAHRHRDPLRRVRGFGREPCIDAGSGCASWKGTLHLGISFRQRVNGCTRNIPSRVNFQGALPMIHKRHSG